MARRRRWNGVLYKSYMFRKQDPIVKPTLKLLHDSGLTKQEIHERSGVAVSTITNWENEVTRSPKFATINATGRVVGYELGWQKMQRWSR